VLGQHPEPVRDLKFAFRDFDVTDAGWKMLVHTPPAYFDFGIANTRNDDLFDVHLWVLHACLGAGRQLPKRVLDRLVMPHGREPRQRVLLDPTFVERYWKPFLRALGRRLDPVSSAEELRTFLDGEFEDVYDWLEWEDPRIDANQARAGWAWMVRQHRAWQEREREFASSRRAEMRWDVPLPTFVHGRWQVVALRDSYELWEEGHHMRHCARTYADPCKNGEYVVFSIRNSSGERVATGGLERRAGRWEAGNVRVFANRPASPILVAVAQAYAAAFDEVARSGRCNDRVAA
jgi:hypothetical protein